MFTCKKITSNSLFYCPVLSPLQPASVVQSSISGNIPSPDGSGRRQCIALYDCKADNEDELSFRSGEIINIISQEEDEWWVSKQRSTISAAYV
jgi:SH3 domain